MDQHRIFSLNGAVLNFLVLVGLLSLNLAVFTIDGTYSGTFALFLCLGLAFYKIIFTRVHISLYVITLVFCLYFHVIAITWLTKIDVIEFYKSFVQTILFVVVFLFTLEPPRALVRKLNFLNIIPRATYFIVAFEAVQISEWMFLGSTKTWFLFEGTLISSADQIGRFEAANLLGYPRPISFFQEPTYLAMILFLLLVFNISFNGRRHVTCLCVTGILFSLSATVIFFLFAFLLINLKFKKTILACASLLLFWFFYRDPESVIAFLRLNEFVMPGTSGYERIVSPIRHVVSSVKLDIFGIPLGNSSIVLNNSLFLFPLYFGCLAAPLSLFFFFFVKRRLKKNVNFLNFLILSLCVFNVNGAIFTPEFAFLFALINLSLLEERPAFRSDNQVSQHC